MTCPNDLPAVGLSSTAGVSVVIPVYNGAKYLKQAIDSVLAQTYTDIELVVVDDGSTDDTPAVIAGYRDRVRSLRQVNAGVASALNAGIRAARGRYIAWLSHDDLFVPEKIARQVAFLKANPEFSACYTDYRTIDAQDRVLTTVRSPWHPASQARKALFQGMYINGSTMLLDRACFERVGLFSEALRYTQDVEMWLRLLETFEIGHVPEILGLRRLHAEQWSMCRGDHKHEEDQTYRRLFETLGPANILPELGAAADTPAGLAKALVWYGDAMSHSRGLFVLAASFYARSLRIAPHWGNLAWRKLPLALALAAAVRVREVLQGICRRLASGSSRP